MRSEPNLDHHVRLIERLLEEMPVEAAAAARAVVADDGKQIQLVLLRGGPAPAPR
jgi:hypothetical protein